MFEFVRKYKYVNAAILALLVVPFAFFGLEAYTRSMRGADDVAIVDGTPVTAREFSDELQRQQQRMRNVLGRGADLSMLDTPEARQALLDSIIAKRVVGAAAIKSKLTVTDGSLREIIAETPEFQGGSGFSMGQYEAVLRAQGLTTVGYEARLRYDIATSQLARAVAETAIPGRAVAQRLANLENEAREVAEAALPADAYVSRVQVEQAQVRAYYEQHAAEFRAPEQLRAEVLVLSAEALGKAEPVSDSELRAAYEARANQYRLEEQRRASHILIQVPPQASDEERQAARKKTEDILAELKKAPGRFAELARKHSQDPGSAEKGGDLGMFGRGMMVKPFEDAVYAMKQGETSGAVQSEFGFHVIRLTAIQAAKGKTFDAVRGELLAELRQQKGLRRFNEAAEAFSNQVYEQADSLAPAAAQFKLQIQTSGWITRAGSPQLAALRHRRLLDALFSSDSIGGRRNTDAVEISPSVIAAARVLEHRAAVQRPYEEVRQDIERLLKRAEAAKLSHREGSAKLEALLKGTDAGLKWGATRQVSRRAQQGLGAEAVQRILSADVARLPSYIGIERGDAGYALYRISRVIAAEARTDAQSGADLTRAERQVGLANYEAFVANLRSGADIRINEANLKSKP